MRNFFTKKVRWVKCDKLYLIYPKIDGIKQESMDFKYDDEMRLKIVYFDLEKDENNANLLT